MRVESAKQMHNGGYLHKLTEPIDTSRRIAAPPPVHLTEAQILDKWGRWTFEEPQLWQLVESLGISVEAARACRPCWAWPHDAWGFPMCNGRYEFVGMRLRAMDGKKWALRGSRQGIFIPDAAPQPECCIVEGPTDLAALLHLGLWGIGRPSCTGGVGETIEFCRSAQVKTVTIFADNDGPGMQGALALSAALPFRHRVVALPQKDLRAYVLAGGTREGLAPYLQNATWRRR